MIGTPGLIIDYDGGLQGWELIGLENRRVAPDPLNKPTLHRRVSFINRVNNGKMDGYGFEELKEDYDMFTITGVPITMDII